MAKRGRKPTDPKILQIRSMRKGLKAKLAPLDERPRRPQWLIGRGRRIWERVMPQLSHMGLISPVDRDLLALYCKTYADWLELGDLMEEEIGRTRGKEKKLLIQLGLYKTKNGNLAYHPIIGRRKALEDQWIRLGKEFGLTINARSGLPVKQSRKKENDKTRFFERHPTPGA